MPGGTTTSGAAVARVVQWILAGPGRARGQVSKDTAAPRGHAHGGVGIAGATRGRVTRPGESGYRDRVLGVNRA